mgnify:CR=1 FL=1
MKVEKLYESYLKVDKFGYELIDQLGYSGCVRYGTGLEDGRVYADDVTLKQIQNELGNKCGQNYDIIEEANEEPAKESAKEPAKESAKEPAKEPVE